MNFQRINMMKKSFVVAWKLLHNQKDFLFDKSELSLASFYFLGASLFAFGCEKSRESSKTLILSDFRIPNSCFPFFLISHTFDARRTGFLFEFVLNFAIQKLLNGLLPIQGSQLYHQQVEDFCDLLLED